MKSIKSVMIEKSKRLLEVSIEKGRVKRNEGVGRIACLPSLPSAPPPAKRTTCKRFFVYPIGITSGRMSSRMITSRMVSGAPTRA